MQTDVSTTHKELIDVFKKHSDKQFIFVEPGGNYGDYLIYKGAQKLANLAGVTYKSATHKEFMNMDIDENDVVYIHGSGGFHPFWSGTPTAELIKAVQNHKGVTILGPSTFYEDVQYVKEEVSKILSSVCSQKIYFFAREKKTFSMLKEVITDDVELGIAYDTALALDKTDILSSNEEELGRYVLYAIRQDKESKEEYLRPHPFVFWVDPAREVKDFNSWVEIHKRAKVVYTNRTHSGILSTILGKKVYFLPNQYHKNRSIWEFSLKDKGVVWMDSLNPADHSKDNRQNPIYSKLVNSYKFNRMLKKYYAGKVIK